MPSLEVTNLDVSLETFLYQAAREISPKGRVL